MARPSKDPSEQGTVPMLHTGATDPTYNQIMRGPEGPEGDTAQPFPHVYYGGCLGLPRSSLTDVDLILYTKSLVASTARAALATCRIGATNCALTGEPGAAVSRVDTWR